MFTKHTLIYSLALLASVFLLTGCPPPPDLTQWQRPNSTVNDARVAMEQCGVPLPGPQPDFTDNETVLYYHCMEQQGFVLNMVLRFVTFTNKRLPVLHKNREEQ
uniref:Lipoprotein n=1 Tax=Yersinia enterocolitica W22703 TaxID=913028 RepID=F4N7P0_YEREN|nr:unknown protein [Yersinia enterocolitica W22703]